VKSHICRNVQDQGGLAHGRTRGNQDQVGILQAGRFHVQIIIACRQTRDVAGRFGSLVDLIHCRKDDFLDRRIFTVHPLLEHVENAFLRFIKDIRRLFLLLIALSGDFIRRPDQLPERRLVLDDFRIMADICRCRH